MQQDHVNIRTGVGIDGLTMSSPGVVNGVHLDTGETVEGDFVIASTGRRGDVPGWLGAHGIDIPETVRESGLMYLTRWYRLPANYEVDMAKLGGDLGFVKFLAVPGDGDTLSITLAIRPDDKDLRATAQPRRQLRGRVPRPARPVAVLRATAGSSRAAACGR